MAEESESEIEFDFDAQMRSISEEAAKRPAAEKAKAASENVNALGSMLRPIAVRLEELARSSAEHSRLLEKISGFERAFAAQDKMLEAVRSDITKLEASENQEVSHQMFSALHEELQNKQENYIFENFQRPLIMELIAIYDSLADFGKQLEAIEKTLSDALSEDQLSESGLAHMPANLENLGAQLLEVFSRYEVECVQTDSSRLDKRLQRAVRVTPTDDPDKDQEVIQQLRPPFVKGERVLRPGNVAIYKYEANSDTPPAS